MEEMIFATKEHELFYNSAKMKCRTWDTYHSSFFYTVGIAADTRIHIGDIFDFDNDCIIPEGLHQGWQTGGSSRITRLAFNLWNGYVEKKHERLYSPHYLFDCSYALYFFFAISHRYPEYCML